MLDVRIQARRDATVAKRFFKRLPAGSHCDPRVIVTPFVTGTPPCRTADGLRLRGQALASATIESPRQRQARRHNCPESNGGLARLQRYLRPGGRRTEPATEDRGYDARRPQCRQRLRACAQPVAGTFTLERNVFPGHNTGHLRGGAGACQSAPGRSRFFSPRNRTSWTATRSINRTSPGTALFCVLSLP